MKFRGRGVTGCLAIVIVGSGCKDAPPTPSPESPRGLLVKNMCAAPREGMIALHLFAAVTTHFARPIYGTVDKRHLWQLSCDRATKKCDGIYLDLNDYDAGKPLGWSALWKMDGDLVSETDGMSVVKVGEYRTITVDLSRHRISIAESDKDAQGENPGRGEADCEGI